MSEFDEILLDVSSAEDIDAGVVLSAAGSIVEHALFGLKGTRSSIWLRDAHIEEITCLISEPKSTKRSVIEGSVDYASCVSFFETLKNKRYVISNDVTDCESSSLDYLGSAHGETTSSVIDCPIRYRGEVIGLLRCEADEHRYWGDKEGRFLSSLADMVGRALLAQRWQSAEAALLLTNQQLEEKVKFRTNELTRALDDLSSVQDQLVESEKMAALGGLVAGVAHEINTPIGICISAISHIRSRSEALEASFLAGDITEEELTSFLNSSKETLELSLHHLQRTANLVKSFKQVAVDQSIDEIDQFNLHDKLEVLIVSFRHELKTASARMMLECPRVLLITTYPGALDQVITNLTMNSILHGFNELEGGEIQIIVSEVSDDKICLRFSDNGSGVSEENRKKIFDPFFTTRRNHGGTGLGLNILYNLVTHKMKGKVQLLDSVDTGATFELIIPRDIAGNLGSGNLGSE